MEHKKLLICLRRIRNILRMGQNEDRTSYFSRIRDEDRRRVGGGGGATTPHGGASDPWGAPPPGVWAMAALWRRLSAYISPFEVKTLEESVFFQKKFRSSAAATDEIRGIEVSVSAPFWDGEVPPEPSPSTPSPSPPSPSISPPSPSPLLPPMMRRE
jgi:hypothetical protein